MTARLPKDLVRELDAIAQKTSQRIGTKLSRSAALEMVLRAGLRRMEDEGEIEKTGEEKTARSSHGLVEMGRPKESEPEDKG